MSANNGEIYWISYSDSGVLISRQKPDGPELFRQQHSSIEMAGFENQLLDEGYADVSKTGTEIPWESLYALFRDENYQSALYLLGLPSETSLTLRLNSKGSLTDRDFQITVAGGIDANGNPVSVTALKGGIVCSGRELALLRKPVWRLAHLVSEFYRRADADRNESFHRRQWGVIRRAAIEANAEMADFLRRTVVLSPEKLRIGLRKNHVGEESVVEVYPTFDEAPENWISAFDKAVGVRERYDISTADGVVQILTTAEIRSVLGEIKRMPGRRITGPRAEAFLLNPFAALGSDAVTVVDEKQFLEAKSEAGIAFERFRPHIYRNTFGYPFEIGIEIDEADGASTRHLFKDDAELFDFTAGLQKRLERRHPIYGWRGREFELDGNTPDYLAQLIAASEDRKKPSIEIFRDHIYDLSQYSPRISEIGQDRLYISTYIIKRKDDEGWFPDNLLLCLKHPDREELIPMSAEQFDRWDQDIASAEAAGRNVINLPGTSEEIPLAEARKIVDEARGPLRAPEPPELPGNRVSEPSISPPKPPTLIIRGNIDLLEHPEPAEPGELVLAAMERPAALKKDVELRTHQIEGIARMQQLFARSPGKCRGVLLADDMGLGKTIQLLTLIAWSVEKFPGLTPALVVAPVSLLENWRREIDQFFHPGSLAIITAFGSALSSLRVPRENIDAALRTEGLVRFLRPDWRGNARIVLTTYETLRDLEFSFAQESWSIMICDEAQKIKNPNAMITRAAKKQNVKFRIACTGTPVENSLADLWCLYDFVQPGFLGALNEFGKEYGLPIEELQEHGRERLATLRSQIEPLLIRRMKSDVAEDLPKKISAPNCTMPMSPEQRKHYAGAIQHLANGDSSKKSQHLGVLQRLRLICADPRPYGVETFVPEDPAVYRRKAPKMDWLLQQLEHIRAQNEKALIFAEYRDIQRLLKHYIQTHFDYVADIINGDTAVSSSVEASRQRKIDKFQASPGFGVIILSPLAVGFGVNIQAANHVIHYLRHWNPAKEDQATDRAYRIGAKKDVYVYCPITVADDFKTFDVKLDELLRRKRALATDTLLGYGRSLEGEIDIRDILPPEMTIRNDPITPERLISINGKFFEKLVAKLWRLQGYPIIKKAPDGGGDGGVDVIAIRGQEGVFIQCKTSSTEGNQLSWDAIKEVVAGANIHRHEYPGITFECICVTNQTFNKDAREKARRSNVALIERDELGGLLQRFPMTELDVENWRTL